MTVIASSLDHRLRRAEAQIAGVLRAGRVYRREDLAQFSNAIDRHLRELVAGGHLTKVAQGLYYAPRNSGFGALPPDDTELVAAFLRDKHFLVFSPSAYNSVGLGTTQLYNRTLVYNHKRHGVFKLGNRQFDFRMKPRFPRTLTDEFLFVDALNNLGELAEDRAGVLIQAERRARSYDRPRLHHALDRFGTVATRKRVRAWLNA